MINSKYMRILFTSILSISLLGVQNAYSEECTNSNSNGHCYKTSQTHKNRPVERDGDSTNTNKEDNSKVPSDSSNNPQTLSNDYQNWVNWFNNNYQTITDETGAKMYARKTTNRRPGEPECYSENERPGKYTRIREKPITSDDTATYTVSCQPNDTKTLTPTNPKETPKGPTIEEMLQEIEDQFANTNIQAPKLKQSYNLGSGQGEDNPNVYKNQAVNFYVDAPTARWEGDLMIGHVEIESYPTQMTIQYGNGDEDTFYTMGKPVSRARGEEPRKTATSYVYKRSGNFHAYATVSYAGRFRVNGGAWQALDVVLTKDTVDPLLIRVWWVDVGRVGGTCDEDDTRWGCKNDPTMGKKDNPNPRLRKADIRTGQRWHLDDSGVGDSEYSLHRDWPDM